MTAEQLLAPRPPEIRELAKEIRGLVRTTLGDPEERVNPSWGGLAYHDAQAGYVCGIFPRSHEVRLLFEHGTALDDPEGIFTGGGGQTRYLDIRPGDVVPEEAICRMIGRAVLYGVMRRGSRR